MSFFIIILILLFIVSFWWMFLSYNFIYDVWYKENINKVQNYKILSNNNKLFDFYFENTTWKFNQLYWFIPSWYYLDLWKSFFSWLKIYFTWYIYLNNNKIYVKSWDYLNYSWNYNISIKNTLTWWQYFFIDWLTWNFLCNFYYYQKIWYNIYRKYIIFTSTWVKFTLISWDYDASWKRNDINFYWSFSWNKSILWKYYFDIYSWDLLYTWWLNWLNYCSWLNCNFTWYDFETWDYKFKIKIYLKWILNSCNMLSWESEISIDE